MNLDKVLDLSILRPMAAEINELKHRLYSLEKEYDRIIFDATGYHPVHHFISYEAKLYDQQLNAENGLKNKLYSGAYSVEDMTIILGIQMGDIQKDIGRRKWREKSPKLYRLIQIMREQGKYSVAYHLEEFWVTYDITTLQGALDVKDKMYKALKGIGPKTLSELRRSLWECYNKE